MTSKERVASFRERLKKDERKYEEYLEKERERNRKRREDRKKKMAGHKHFKKEIQQKWAKEKREQRHRKK